MSEKRIITSKDVPGGTVYGRNYDKIRQRNENPDLGEDKPYTYLGNIKTDTKVHGWHFVFENKFYVATYHYVHGCTSQIAIWESDKKAKFDIPNPLKKYLLYCDIETVVDMFCAEELAKLEKTEETV
jgi:hypothetical protein